MPLLLLGVVLYVLVQDRFPFNDRDWKALYKSQMARDYRISSRLTSQCKELIQAHLDPNPSTRGSMLELMQHEWFGADKASLLDKDDD